MKNPLQPSTSSSSSSVAGGIALNATVGRSACRYTRIAHLYPHGHQQLGRRPSNFRLAQHKQQQPATASATDADATLALAITADEGIVYVSRPELLKQTSSNWLILEVSWDVGGQKSVPLPHSAATASSAGVTTSCLIRIDLINDTKRSSSSATADVSECNESLLCAAFRSEHDCQQAQGSVATDQRGCSWRHGHSRDNSSSFPGGSPIVVVSSLSRQYQTCSPDLSTCPDGYCDDLESQSWEICPQDCTGKSILIIIIYRSAWDYNN